jgi:ribonucleoside-diphosphate reductase alpha chain
VVHHFSVGGHEGYLIVGLYESGQPGEIFIRMAKAGSTIAGLMDSFGIAVSMGLQFGVSLETLCQKFSYTRFEPGGWTGVKEIGYASSLTDYIFRWLRLKFLPHDSSPVTGAGDGERAVPAPVLLSGDGLKRGQADAPVCKECGSIMSPNGSCYKCSLRMDERMFARQANVTGLVPWVNA